MANDKPAVTGNGTDELDDLAFRIYAERLAAHPSRRSGEAEAIDSYRQAEVFLGVRRRIKAGELKPAPAGAASLLADCWAPNLPRTHPYNLVSQQQGDLTKVSRIKRFLDANPTPENDPAPLIVKINRDFADLNLNWDLPTINLARAILPAHCQG